MQVLFLWTMEPFGPSGMKITSVRCGWVWGVEHDELDVGYVVRYALQGVDVC